jgi:hypothetical protein
MSRKGVIIKRVGTALPGHFCSFLSEVAVAKCGVRYAWCFDTDARVQADLLGVFSCDNVRFLSPLGQNTVPHPSTVVQSTLQDTLVEINPEVYPVSVLTESVPEILRCRIIVVRSHLAYFWSGDGDLADLVAILCRKGYTLVDVLDYAQPMLLSGHHGYVSFVFTVDEIKMEAGARAEAGSRCQEAMAKLSKPLARREDSRWLAGRGAMGFPYGVFNPGAISENGRVTLLANGEMKPWVRRRDRLDEFIPGTHPVLAEIGKADELRRVRTLVPKEYPVGGFNRIEDFRLFSRNGEIYTNHAATTLPGAMPPGDRPTPLDRLVTRVAISRIDKERGELRFLGFPQIGRPLDRIEKNWGMFTHNDELYLLYSFAPYRLYRLVNWQTLAFEPVIEAKIPAPSFLAGMPLRNSINPIDFDADHWLHVVHAVYPVKQYVFWGVLIRKKSLLPVAASRHPLIHGWHSFPASVIYACSAAVREPKTLTFLAGIDDCSSVSWTIPQERLWNDWSMFPPVEGQLAL